MAPQVKTRERIIRASLELFNTQGERNVTTNHIAAHMGISPGNLYYHFRNKQAVIAELMQRYEAQVDQFLRLPEERPVVIEDKAVYMERLLAAMWQFRFLHRDLEHLLESDAQLAERYQVFAKRCLHHAMQIFQGFVDAGILLMTPLQIEALTLNSWIVLTSWVRFLCTAMKPTTELDEQLLRRGVFQVMALEDGYVAPQWQEAAREIYDSLYVQLDLHSHPVA
jgi:AcrR family transcriptional regulator